jgi:hypothetical protein
MYRTTSIPTLSIAAAVLTAWASPSHAQAGNACALLTTAQVTAALGTAVEAGVPLVASNPTSCGWAPPGGPNIDAKKVTVQLSTLKSFEASKKPMSGIEKTPLSGVGDDAIYVTTPGFGTGLNVRKGNSAFQVRVGGFKPDKEKEIEKALAMQILKKL